MNDKKGTIKTGRMLHYLSLTFAWHTLQNAPVLIPDISMIINNMKSKAAD